MQYVDEMKSWREYGWMERPLEIVLPSGSHSRGRGRTDNCIQYVCMVITYSRVWINRVRLLPILLVISGSGKINIPLSPFAPENLVSRDGFSRPVPRRPAHSPYSSWICCILTRDSSRFPYQVCIHFLARTMRYGVERAEGEAVGAAFSFLCYFSWRYRRGLSSSATTLPILHYYQTVPTNTGSVGIMHRCKTLLRTIRTSGASFPRSRQAPAVITGRRRAVYA